MKIHFQALILISFLAVFCIITGYINRQKLVLSVVSPVEISVTDRNHTENICIDNTEAFSLAPSFLFYDKYSELFSLSKSDMIGLGYLADEFAQKTLVNKKVFVKYSSKVTTDNCKWASVYLKGIDYSDLLFYNGFSVRDNEVYKNKFDKNLEFAKKLNLVILNHHSNKYHTLDCPYGNIAHDSVILPEKQLPHNAVPCKFCHNVSPAVHKKYSIKAGKDIIDINNVIIPPLVYQDSTLKYIHTDYTRKKRPDRLCDTTACTELVGLINEAKSTVDIAIYGYDDIPKITKALQNAKNRGVDIRFVYDEGYLKGKTYYKDNETIKNLAVKSISDRSLSKVQSNMIMHNKFVIFDKKIVYTGSLNFSLSGMSDYDVNDILIIHSSDVAKFYAKEFEQMLGGKFHNSKIAAAENRKFNLSNGSVEVYFLPQDNAAARIINLIDGAASTIYVPAFLITHKDISNSLISARQRGVDVRVIVDANSAAMPGSKHGLLRNNSVLLKVENYGGKLHSKTMIIDDEYVITGSMNFSGSGTRKNDENLLIIRNPLLAQNCKNFFLYLWTKIPNKYLKYNPKSESPESINSCSDGIDNNFNGKVDMEEELCRVK